MKRILLGIIVLFGAVLLINTHITGSKSKAPQPTVTTPATSIDELRFSNTQVWDVEPYNLASSTAVLAFTDISLPPPPQNSSTTTTQELEELHNFTSLRTEQKLAEIEAELVFPTTSFGSSTLGNILSQKPATFELFAYVIGSADPVILEAKRYFDRVRPSFLDPTLSTAIPVPNHPAYPSAHAVNANLVAQLFSELDPANSRQYELDAMRIAHNREIAGVHYPSDSAAGKDMAGQLYQLLNESGEFVSLLQAAKNEW